MRSRGLVALRSLASPALRRQAYCSSTEVTPGVPDILPTLDALPEALRPKYAVVASSKRPSVDISAAIRQVKEAARAKFVESVDVSVKLNIDPKRGDQIVRSVATLPHGTGKSIRLCVFATGEAAQRSLDAGADLVGDAELISSILASKSIPFDKCLATAEMMPALSKIARILGPRGLMPNPKLGSIVTDATLGTAIADLKKGQVAYRNDKGALIHAGIGRVDFTEEHLRANLTALLQSVVVNRPKTAKSGSGGKGFIQSLSLSSTMGRSVAVKLDSALSLVD